MATPIVQIGFDQVNTELALTPTAQISMNDAAVRTLAGVPTPGTQISMSNLQGKSNAWTGTISTPQANLNLYTWATTVASPAYPGTGPASITVAPGVYIYADGATGATVYGMNIPASFPSTVSIVNNGYIMGQGGYGGAGSPTPKSPAAGVAALPGGPAINLAKPVTITNNSYIAGGGGGGAGTSQAAPGPAVCRATAGGGGAGGGSAALATCVPVAAIGGAIGIVGASGSNAAAGAAGGRILPGTGGAGSSSPTVFAAGGGGGGGGGRTYNALARPGPLGGPVGFSAVSGGGGGWGAAGGGALNGYNSPVQNGTGGAGGGSNVGGAIGVLATPNVVSPFPSGTGGQAIKLNANSVTWGATGTVYGSVA